MHEGRSLKAGGRDRNSGSISREKTGRPSFVQEEEEKEEKAVKKKRKRSEEEEEEESFSPLPLCDLR